MQPAPSLSPRSLASLAPAFNPQTCAIATCFRPAVVEYGERLCGECALLALEFDTREAEEVQQNAAKASKTAAFGEAEASSVEEALPGAVSRELAVAETSSGHGDAGRWVVTDDPAGQFRWDALPGRMDAGIAVLDASAFNQVQAYWAGLDTQPDSGLGVPEANVALAESEDPRETPIFLPCMGRCGARVRYGGHCKDCAARAFTLRAAFAPEPNEEGEPASPPVSLPRVETGLRAAPEKPLGVKFYLTLIGICVVLKVVLAW